jgi:hypothetical protein
MASPFTRITQQSVEDRALRTLQEAVAQLPNRLAFERWLRGFPEETRQEIRRMLQSSGRFTVEALRAERIAREAEQQATKARALRLVSR